MRQSLLAAILIAALSGTAVYAMEAEHAAQVAFHADPLAAAIDAPGRSAEHRARDRYRHPAETLAFFGITPGDTVVELWPGGAGWYTEILAPYLAPAGSLYVAAPIGKATDAIGKKLAADPVAYGKVKVATFPMAEGGTPVPAGSADAVLTFRNVHNWRFGGADRAQAAFDQIFAMLKPGGTLGVVEHRLPEAMDSALEAKSGYMKRSSIIGFATKAGFELVDESDVNANPADTHDYPKGVWTLPPDLTEGAADRAKYVAIGESDRMTLKFRKPAR